MIKISPMQIVGEWTEGYALDIHIFKSIFLGHDEYGHPQFDNIRSEIGELVYRLKYKSDKSVIPTISETAAIFIKKQNWNPDAIIPVPPSRTSRSFQPVLEVAECLSQSLGIEIYPECIEKVLETPELKDVTKHDERIRTLNNAFKVADKSIVEGQRVLLFDDLYSSGVTLNSIARELNQHGNVMEIFALTLTKTKRIK